MKKKAISMLLMVFFVALCACGLESDISSTEEISEECVYVDGITEEYEILFLADSHISECDKRDEEVMPKAMARREAMSLNGKNGYDHFRSFVKLANKEDSDLLILGGDIVDSAMYASIEAVEKGLKDLECPYIYTFGNHDFEYGSEYFTQTAYDNYRQRFEKVRKITTSQIMEFDEFVVVSADDDNNQVTMEAYTNLLRAFDLNKPIILVTHVPFEPLVNPEMLLEDCIDIWGPSQEGRSRVTIGDNGKTPNEITRKFIDLAFSEDSPVAVVLAGHIHFYHRDQMTSKIDQIITGAAYEGKAIRLTLKPNPGNA